MPKTKPIVSIENVVASASVEQKMYLNEITRKFSDVEYHPDQFPGLVFRLLSPKTATLIFTSGKMVCTGAKSEEMSRKAVKTVVQKLRKGGVKVKKDAVVVIQNIVASINLGGRIQINVISGFELSPVPKNSSIISRLLKSNKPKQSIYQIKLFAMAKIIYRQVNN